MDEQTHKTPRAKQGSVRYMNAEGLKRELSFPKQLFPLLIGIALIAAVIGMIWLTSTMNGITKAREAQITSVDDALEQTSAPKLPMLANLLNQDASTMSATLSSAGFNIVDVNKAKNNNSPDIDFVKLPDNMDTATATALYLQGVEQISPAQAIQLLAGSWRLTSAENDLGTLSLKYADFKSASLDAALTEALKSQGMAEATIDDEGVDDAGNTYKSGTFDTDAGTVNFKVSACLLSEVYTIEDAPTEALYVGIHISQPE